jgi:uncharacterized membrane protein YfcA
MAWTSLAILVVLFFVTSVVGVVTGSNSLITVPVMFQFGIDEKVAVATNMFGLTFMAIGGTIPFVRAGLIEYRKLSPLVILTLIGSAIGAALVGLISNQSIKLIVSIAMIAVVLFTIIRGETTGPKASPPASDTDGLSKPMRTDRFLLAAAYPIVFLLAIYGGLYSGGYVTILTVAFIAFFGMTYSGAIAATKFVNVFSSAIATAIFMWQGLVDYSLGVILAVTMFAGAFAGAHFVTMMDEVWLKRIFVVTVFILAIKTLFDFL